MSAVNMGGENNQATYVSDSRKYDHVDTQALGEELSTLLEVLRKEATDTEHFISMGNVGNAQQSLKQGKIAQTYEYLSKAGKWVLDIAQKAGSQVVAKVIQTTIDLK